MTSKIGFSSAQLFQKLNIVSASLFLRYHSLLCIYSNWNKVQTKTTLTIWRRRIFRRPITEFTIDCTRGETKITSPLFILLTCRKLNWYLLGGNLFYLTYFFLDLGLQVLCCTRHKRSAMAEVDVILKYFLACLFTFWKIFEVILQLTSFFFCVWITILRQTRYLTVFWWI